MSEGVLKGKIVSGLLKNKAKLILIVGILGIALIFLSSFFESGNSNTDKDKDNVNILTSDQYCELLEKKVKTIVTGITGSKNSVVVVTLDTGVQYVYADNEKRQTSNSEQSDKKENSDSNEQNYIIITDKNGDEQPLIITEYMPSVRGVAIVCEGGYDPTVTDRIKNAVMSALDITSKKIYVTGK